MPLSAGERLGSYEISGLDVERLRRFEKEARAASALNHPNIVTSDGKSYAYTYIRAIVSDLYLLDGVK